MTKKILASLSLLTLMYCPVQAVSNDNLFDLLAQAREDQWETHAGFGLSFGLYGMPSMIANELAMKEGYVHSISEPRGLPMGLNFFAGFGYKVSAEGSMGLEFGGGLHADGGKARVQLGDTLTNPNAIPGYVYDAIFGNATDRLMGILGGIQFTPQTYQWLSTMNTMKGFYLDPKVRVYYRHTMAKWNVQTGVGAGLIIPFGYFAYPSKDPQDYKRYGVTENNILFAVIQPYLNPVRVPFPLTLRDGSTMMRAFQPVADFHVRAAYKLAYVEMGYATNFMHVHNLKLAVGMSFI